MAIGTRNRPQVNTPTIGGAMTEIHDLSTSIQATEEDSSPLLKSSLSLPVSIVLSIMILVII